MRSVLRLVAKLRSSTFRGKLDRSFSNIAEDLDSRVASRSLGFRIPRSSYYQGKTGADNLRALFNQYLSEVDWVFSRTSGFSAIGSDLVPWLTYPLIRFLERWDLSRESVLEFGGGASSVWFSMRAKSLVTWEFDAEYASALRRANLPGNSEIRCTDSGFRGDLSKSNLDPALIVLAVRDEKEIGDGQNPTTVSFFEQFVSSAAREIHRSTLILVDGGFRNLILGIVALEALPETIVVVDNSDWVYLADGIRDLKNAGFIEIPFKGLGPINAYEFQSSVFVKGLDALARVSS